MKIVFNNKTHWRSDQIRAFISKQMSEERPDLCKLEVVEKKSKKKPVDQKLAHAQNMLKAAMTREKRAVTLRKKWQTKVAYYTKKYTVPPSVSMESKQDGEFAKDQIPNDAGILEATC